MPLYVYRCPKCEHQFEELLKLVHSNFPVKCPECGKIAEKQLTAPAIHTDYAAYSCPITGKMIEGRRAHQENLKRHGCRVLEPGETQEASRRKASEEAAFDNNIEATVEQFVASLPTAKMEKLASEVQAGVTATVVRQ